MAQEIQEWMRKAVEEIQERNRARDHVLHTNDGTWDDVMPTEEMLAIIASHAPSTTAAPRGERRPINRPCSACSAGDYQIEYHLHYPPFADEPTRELAGVQAKEYKIPPSESGSITASTTMEAGADAGVSAPETSGVAGVQEAREFAQQMVDCVNNLPRVMDDEWFSNFYTERLEAYASQWKERTAALEKQIEELQHRLGDSESWATCETRRANQLAHKLTELRAKLAQSEAQK